MSFIAIIPARLASSRLPEKILAEIGGKPMVVHVAERARAAGAQQTLIATDSPRVAEVVQAYGFEAVMTRAEHTSGTDRLAEVVERSAWPDDTLIVNVQGDEPLFKPTLLGEIAAHLAKHDECAIATAAYPISQAADIFNPNIVKVVLDKDGRALYFSRAPIPWAREAYQALPEIQTIKLPPQPVYHHIGLYAYRAGFLRRFTQLPRSPLEETEALEQLRALWHGERIAVLITEQAPAAGVDTPTDLIRVRAILGG